ncbi:HNH endonuclease [Nostoc flagelliforme]|uniref:HNH endonuclease n=1 Tax=Nostoc flagelliforme TaxID=1306274 RepID=UPI001CEC3DFB|nr:HNH endonuclease signature motif containing protein [Nostoc flagelliforme]
MCEYCQLPAEVAFFPHEIDHVIAQKHGGETNAENLALTGWRCNRHKGTDLG